MGRVKSWLDSYKSNNTKKTFRGGLRLFFETVYGSASVDVESLDKQADQYFSESRNYEEDLQNFLNSLEKYTPKTIKSRVTAVRVFLVENDVELRQKFWRRVQRKTKGARAQTEDRAPEKHEMRRILGHLPIQGKALSLTLESSGMRINEALQLNLDEVDLTRNPCKIRLRGEITKTGRPRITFISKEAVEALEEWVKVREEYLQFACQKSNLQHKERNDPRLFPFSDGTAYYFWNMALKKARLFEKDKTTNRATIHFHVLRAVFRSQLGLVIPIDIVEALMGHEGYLQGVYKKYPDAEKTMEEFYVQGEHALLVFTEAPEVEKLKEEIEKGKMEQYEAFVQVTQQNLKLTSEVDMLKRRVAVSEKNLEDITVMVQKLQEEYEKEENH